MPYNKSELKMPSQKPPQTNITEKRSHIMVGTDHPAALSLTPISPQKIYLAKSDRFSPNSLAWQPPTTLSHLMILPPALASFPKNYLALSELAASLFCKHFYLPIFDQSLYIYFWQIGRRPANLGDIMGTYIYNPPRSSLYSKEQIIWDSRY